MPDCVRPKTMNCVCYPLLCEDITNPDSYVPAARPGRPAQKRAVDAILCRYVSVHIEQSIELRLFGACSMLKLTHVTGWATSSVHWSDSSAQSTRVPRPDGHNERPRSILLAKVLWNAFQANSQWCRCRESRTWISQCQERGHVVRVKRNQSLNSYICTHFSKLNNQIH